MSISPTGSQSSSSSWPNSSSSSSSKTSRSSSPKREYDSDCFSDGSRIKSPSRSSSPSLSPKQTPAPSRPASPAPAQHQPTTHAKRPAAEISGGPTFQPKFVQKTQSSINFGGFDTDDEASSSDDDNSAPSTQPNLHNLYNLERQQLLLQLQRELLGLAPTWTQNSSKPDSDDPDLATALSL